MITQALTDDPSNQTELVSQNLKSDDFQEMFDHPLRKTSPEKCGHNTNDIVIILTHNGPLIICKPCWTWAYLRAIQEILDHPLRKKLPEDCDHDTDDIAIVPTPNVPLIVCKSCWIDLHFELGILKPI